MSLLTDPIVSINNKKLSKDDIEVLKSALDIYTRLLMGQFSEVGNHLKVAMQDKVDLFSLNIIADKLKALQKFLHGDENKSWGLYDPEVSITASKANKIEHMLLGNTHIVKSLQQHIDEQISNRTERENHEPG